MKKTLTQLLALTAMMFAPTAANAAGWEKTVHNDAEYKAALESIAGEPGESYIINIDWEEGVVSNTTKRWKPSFTSGRVVIRSNETDFDKMPVFILNVDWQADLVDNGPGKNLSLIFENLNVQFDTGNTGGGQMIYFNTRIAPIDTIAYRHCDINNYGRLIFRSVPKVGNVDEQNDENLKPLDVFELTDSRIHDGQVISSNTWETIRFGQPFNTVNIVNNLFYDTPYATAIMGIQKTKQLGNNPIITFSNNTVLLAQNKSLSKGFSVINTGANLGETATYYFTNNIFMAPQEGLRRHVAYDEFGEFLDYDGKTKILSAEGGIVYENRNVVDPKGYQGWAADLYTKDAEKDYQLWFLISGENDLTPEEAGFTSWTEGEVFQDAPNSVYYVQQSHPAYTMGVVLDEEGNVVEGQSTCLGASHMYTDKPFPAKASISITIDGPSYIQYAIEPVKQVYYAGDEVKVSLTDQNSKYRTFTEFKGWSDGNTDMVRTIILDGDVNLTAKFEEVGGSVISAFTFPTAPAAGNNKLVSYDANIYPDENFKAVATAMILDETTGEYKEVDGTENRLNWRNPKFGEDPAEEQMSVLSRKTPATARAAGKPDFFLFTVSTKGYEDISFAAFVGTDNMGYKTQLADYSLDGTTWTNFAQVDLEERSATFSQGEGKLWGWTELKGKLPAEAGNQEKLYIRIIGDANSEIVDVVVAGTDHENGTMFEYAGNIVITSGEAGTLKGDVNGDGAVDVADISAIISVMSGTNDELKHAADVNGDGAVDVADISNVISIMAGQ